jgi:hypothetical protein
VIVYENLNRKLQRGNTGRKINRSADMVGEYIKRNKRPAAPLFFSHLRPGMAALIDKLRLIFD